jgi:predicted TIM-barrel fold metal-dependent hydrolase
LIDCHTHVGELGVHVREPITSDSERVWGMGFELGVELADHWAAMAGVEKAIVLAFAARRVGYTVPNDYVAGYVRQHPEKLIGFASVDPNDLDAPDQLEYAVTELGLRGLKLGPIYQHFDPLGEEAFRVYKVAERLGLPVMWHQGTTFVRDAPLLFARPAMLDEVARQFPDLRVVIAHLGHPWIEEAMATIRKHPHLYADISALETRPWQYYNGLVAAVEYGVAHKLLLGTDYPFSTIQRTLDGLRSINRICEGTGLPQIPPDVIDGIIERDSLELLGLKSPYLLW